MRRVRFEIEPRPAGVGGGWLLHLVGVDERTGSEEECGGGVFPAEGKDTSDEAYADALQTGLDWLGDVEVEGV